MLAPRELPQQVPTPPAKVRMQKPQGGGNIFDADPRGWAGRGIVMAKIDSCITASWIDETSNTVWSKTMNRVMNYYEQF